MCIRGPKEVEAIMSRERPKLVFEIHNFLGLAVYYRGFIEDFSQLAAPKDQNIGLDGYIGT